MFPWAHGRPGPTRRWATSWSGFWVADRPMRWSGPFTSASSRSTESIMWEPRLSPATAWISSRIRVRTVRSIARPLSLVSRM